MNQDTTKLIREREIGERTEEAILGYGVNSPPSHAPLTDERQTQHDNDSRFGIGVTR